jgi:hypothetical protein
LILTDHQSFQETLGRKNFVKEFIMSVKFKKKGDRKKAGASEETSAASSSRLSMVDDDESDGSAFSRFLCLR